MSENPISEAKVTSTKVEERLTKFSGKIRGFLNSDWSFAFFIGIFVILTVIQFIYDGVINHTLNENNQLAVDLLVFVGSISTVFASIFSTRLKTTFFYFSILGLIFWIWRSLIVGLPLNALKLSILFLPSIVRFIKWSRGDINKREMSIKRIRIQTFLLIILVLIGAMYGVAQIMKLVDAEKLPYIDSGNFVFSLAAASMIAGGFLEGWFVTLISLSFVITSYIVAGLKGFTSISISGIVSAVIFMILNMGTALAWLSLYHMRHNTFKYIKRVNLEKPI